MLANQLIFYLTEIYMSVNSYNINNSSHLLNHYYVLNTVKRLLYIILFISHSISEVRFIIISISQIKKLR